MAKDLERAESLRKAKESSRLEPTKGPVPSMQVSRQGAVGMGGAVLRGETPSAATLAKPDYAQKVRPTVWPEPVEEPIAQPQGQDHPGGSPQKITAWPKPSDEEKIVFEEKEGSQPGAAGKTLRGRILQDASPQEASPQEASPREASGQAGQAGQVSLKDSKGQDASEQGETLRETQGETLEILETIEAQEKRLAEILRNARKRIQARESAEKEGKSTPPPPVPARQIPGVPARSVQEEARAVPSVVPKELRDEVLPIEPFDEAQGKPERATLPWERAKGKIVSAPSNLPVGEDITEARHELFPRPVVLQKTAQPLTYVKEAPPPAPIIERGSISEEKIFRETPEQILGLSQPSAVKDSGGAQEKPKEALFKETGREEVSARPFDATHGKPSDKAQAFGSEAQARRGKPFDEAPAPEGRQGKRKPVIGLKFGLIAGAGTLILMGAAAGAYWKFFVTEPAAVVYPTPEPSPPPKLVEPPQPEALIGYDATMVIEISELSADALRSKIAALKDSNFQSDSLAYVPLKLVNDQEIRYLSPFEFFDTLKIGTPENLSDYYEDLTVYLYTQTNAAREECIAAEIFEKTCYGPRIGLVMKQKIEVEGAQKEIVGMMIEWEKTIVGDLAPLMLATPKRKQGDTFRTGEFEDLSTRYINIPIPTTSLDWILTDNYLVIGTSKDAARKAVDRLRP